MNRTSFIVLFYTETKNSFHLYLCDLPLNPSAFTFALCSKMSRFDWSSPAAVSSRSDLMLPVIF